MRRATAFRLAAAFAAALACGAPLGAAAVAEAAPSAEAAPPGVRDLAAELAARGPRPENSAEERRVVELVRRRALAAGLRVRELGYEGVEGYHSFARSLRVLLPGRREEVLVLVVPVSTWVDAPPESGAAGLALAVEAMEALAEESKAGEGFPVGLELVFLAAERPGRTRDGRSTGAGTRRLLEELGLAEGRRAVIYLSLDRLGVPLLLSNSGGRTLSPYWIYEQARRALADSGAAYNLEANLMQLTRLGLGDRAGPLDPYFEAGVPAIELRDAPGAAAEGGGTRGGSLVGLLRAFLRASEAGFPETWDRHYLSFQVGGYSFSIRERPYILGLLAFICLASALLILLSLGRSREPRPFHLRTHGFLFSTAALLLLSFGSWLLLSPVHAVESSFLGGPGLWRLAPGLFGLSRLLVMACFFLSALSLAVAARILTPNPYFYEWAALFFLGLDILAYAALAPALAFYFIWAFLAVGFSLALRRPWASLVSLALMYLPFALLAGEVAGKPDYAVYDYLIAPTPGAALSLAVAALPFFVFSASPLFFFLPTGRRSRLATAIALVLLAAILVLAPPARARALLRANPPPVLAYETLDQAKGTWTVELRAEEALGAAALIRGGERLAIAAESALDPRSARISGLGGGTSIRASIRERRFLERSTYELRLSFERAPASVSLRLESDEDFGLFAASLPYEASLDGRSTRLFCGDNPGAELAFSLTARTGAAAMLRVEALGLEPSAPLSLEDGRPLRFETSLTSAAFPLRRTSP